MAGLKITETEIPGLLIVEPRVIGDARGFFMEVWHRERYAEQGLATDFVQDNLSSSQRGVLRGLHFQNPDGQGKLVSVLQGAVYDVAVDIRRGSPTFGEWLALELTSESKRQLYIPPGLAHGFCVTSKRAMLCYKCTAHHNPDAEHALAWDDPAIGIDWPTRTPVLSERDAAAVGLEEFPEGKLPAYG